ncbi:VOC family protein [Lysobacter sp. LF1]|uniref:VOC family protein n=1 Tax=Lysobacter stagni TaxID=3045172 RepID=A0ABT6XFU2_9GAMM|nr:VOC family protein [Lysobacter sp. LF1]MDI9238924.1 VOC family protein [Lysobacter sp. LF1]
MSVPSTPEGYHTVTPYLIVDDTKAALDFYRDALGAEEIYRLPMGDKIGHAEIRIGNSMLMLSDEWPDIGALGPKSRGGATASFVIYVPDVDRAYEHAVKAGAKPDRPVENQAWGDRMGTLIDPFGHKWSLATHVEDVSPEELKRRMDEWMKQQAGLTA